MYQLVNCQELYRKLQEQHPDWLTLFNHALSEAYAAGNDDGYHTGSGEHPSGILSSLGYLRKAEDYQPMFPEQEA